MESLKCPAFARILIIEESDPLRSQLVTVLRDAGYLVDDTNDGTEGIRFATLTPYDAIVLDPDLDGLSVLRQLRSNRIEAHVLIVSAHDRAEDRIAGLDCGADDYVVKPFVHAELLARVRALVRRRHDTKPHVLRTGALEINTATRLVHYHGMQVNLSVREYSILEFLALRAGKVVSRRELWDHLSAFGHERTSNVIDVYIRFLRRKLDKPEMPSLIQTRRSQGYILVAERAGDLSHPVM